MDLLQVGQQRENSLVAQGDVDPAVMRERAHRRKGSRLLTTTQSAGRDEQTRVLAPETTAGPDAAGLVPEGLPLRGEVTVPGGNAEQDGVVLLQLRRLDHGVG